MLGVMASAAQPANVEWLAVVLVMSLRLVGAALLARQPHQFAGEHSVPDLLASSSALRVLRLGPALVPHVVVRDAAEPARVVRAGLRPVRRGVLARALDRAEATGAALDQADQRHEVGAAVRAHR